ncbi:adenosine deaminase [Glycomyces salinus]|uniref:adenosine deaminase n=1 Tax=Glycomyces salinus TaxID=980294 RepID=UPI0018EA70E2|nr:adenosine deaminase [Glycomyces salinus]
MNSGPLTTEQIRSAPKAVLHEHLDGGLRPQTIIDIADEIGYRLPRTEAGELGEWFFDAASSGTLERYLETFAHTVAVLQKPEHCSRVAAEAVQDLAADGVVYAELRYAPEQQQAGGMSLEEVVEATQDGLEEGERLARAAGHTIETGTILCGMRHADRVMEAAQLAVKYRDKGVVGFDIAGAEIGFPASRHKAAFDHLRAESMPFTIHAGESVGKESVWQAVQQCGTLRLGHGVRLDEDLEWETDVDGMLRPRLGRLAEWVRDRRIALEVCPSSNLQTGAASSIEGHPIQTFFDLDFRVTVNNDNRLMSRTSASREFALLSKAFGWGWDEIETVTVNAMEAAFSPYPERRRRIDQIVRPAYRRLRESA